MGKTVAGAVWLNADMLSPYDYWQFWRDTEDADVSRFLKLFTTMPLGEINRLAALQGREINEAKKILATEATALVHGRGAADQAAETARQTFEEGTWSESLPTIEIGGAEARPAWRPVRLRARPAGSSRTAMRASRSKVAVYGSMTLCVTDEKMCSPATHVTPEGVLKLSFGKESGIVAEAGLDLRNGLI